MGGCSGCSPLLLLRRRRQATQNGYDAQSQPLGQPPPLAPNPDYKHDPLRKFMKQSAAHTGTVGGVGSRRRGAARRHR